jgi:putative zinc finger/helix-turn-helix YgiT family protein
MTPLVPEDLSAPRDCDACGAHETATCRFETQSFEYGEGSGKVTLTARVPVWTCSRCGIATTDGDAEDARHDAVCCHLGVLTPGEVRAIREKYGLTQAEFARRTRIGEATIKRWETGVFVQSPANDQYLRLLRDPEVFAKLDSVGNSRRARQENRDIRSVASRFRTALPQSTFEDARQFRLRRLAPENDACT